MAWTVARPEHESILASRVWDKEASAIPPRQRASNSRYLIEPRTAARWLSPGQLFDIALYLPSFSLHYFCGRKVGLFPYLTPFLLLALAGLFLFRRNSAPLQLWALAPFAAYALFYFTIIPTNYHGGPTALGNRYAAQMIPALLFAFAAARAVGTE